MSDPTLTCYFNNSGLPVMTCPRRYRLTYVEGLRYVGNEALSLGSLFHYYMKVIEPGDTLAHLTILPSKQGPPNLTSKFPDYQVSRIRQLALRSTELLGAGPHGREQFCSFETTSLLQTPFEKPPGFRVLDTLTLDRHERVTLGGLGEFLLITDYKTTKFRLSDGDFHANYKLKGQFLFYAIALRHAAKTGQLPPAYQQYTDLLLENRIAARHLFVNYTDKAAEKPDTDQIFLCPPSILHSEQLDHFEYLIAQKRDLAAFLTTRPDLAAKEGVLNGSCYSCPFQQICLLGNTSLEEKAIENWPLGRAPYDPTHGNQD